MLGTMQADMPSEQTRNGRFLSGNQPSSGQVWPRVDVDADREYLRKIADNLNASAETALRGSKFKTAREQAELSEQIFTALKNSPQKSPTWDDLLAQAQKTLLKSLISARAYRDAGNVQLRLNDTLKSLNS